MEAATRFVKRLAYAWRRHGWRLFGPLLLHNIAYQIDRVRGRRGRPDVIELDRKLGIDTYKIEAIALMEVAGENLVRGHAYQPVSEGQFRAALSNLPIEFPRYTFIDYGSGKGRALLLATEFPFRRIIGVEYARELHDVAVLNLARARAHLPGTERVECIWGDATKFDPPPDPLLCFLYNPFDGVVMRALLDRLSRSVAEMPRDVVITYLNPDHRAAIDSHPGATLLREGPSLAVYRVERSGQA
jgi:SAM-dependent methyltransferase